ncbi:MAG: tetratricopeptide repeat protein [bacterium]
MKVLLTILLSLFVLATVSEAVSSEQQKKIDQLKKNAVESFNAGNYSETIAILKEIVSINPADKTAARYLMITEQQVIEPYCKEAAEAYNERDYQKALEHWEKILKIKPEDPRVEWLVDMTKNLIWDTTMNSLYAIANKALKEGKYAVALSELQKILSINPNDNHARELFGTTKLIMRDMEIKDRYAKADAFMKKGEYDAAIGEWKRILLLDENQEAASRFIASAVRTKLNTMYDQALKYYREGEYMASRDLYYLIMSDNPTDQDVKTIVTRLNDVLTIVQKMQNEGQVWDILRKSLANHIAKDGNVKAAIAGSWYAIQLEPNNTVALGVRDFLESKHPSVVRSMEPPARNMNIIDQYLFASLNNIYEGRYDLAIEACGIIIELQPKNVLAWKRMGSAYFAIGQKDKAKGAWEKALTLAPEDAELKKFISQTK